MVNCIIGSGVFGLPSVISALVGSASPFAWLFAAAGTGLVMACFAEVSSRFEHSGGVYLYTRTAFGRAAGITIAWFGWLTRLTAAAANANLFVIYLAEFWPPVKTPFFRFLVLTLLLGFLAIVNYIGVRRGTTLSNVFTAAKLLTLGGFILAGLLFLGLKHHPLIISPPAGPSGNWLQAVLLLMFAYGGYDRRRSEKSPPRLSACLVCRTCGLHAGIYDDAVDHCFRPAAVIHDRPSHGNRGAAHAGTLGRGNREHWSPDLVLRLSQRKHPGLSPNFVCAGRTGRHAIETGQRAQYVSHSPHCHRHLRRVPLGFFAHREFSMERYHLSDGAAGLLRNCLRRASGAPPQSGNAERSIPFADGGRVCSVGRRRFVAAVPAPSQARRMGAGGAGRARAGQHLLGDAIGAEIRDPGSSGATKMN